MNRVSLAAAVNVLAVIAAIWLGEHATGPDGMFRAALAAVTFAFLTAALHWRRSRAPATVFGMTSLIVFALAWSASAREASRAFNECVADGQRVRQALDQYRRVHHQFPARLSELSMQLPGQLVLPPRLLKYERTGTGYRLSFSDWLVTYQASDRQAFLAVK